METNKPFEWTFDRITIAFSDIMNKFNSPNTYADKWEGVENELKKWAENYPIAYPPPPPPVPERVEEWEIAFDELFPRAKDIHEVDWRDLKDGFMEGYKYEKADDIKENTVPPVDELIEKAKDEFAKDHTPEYQANLRPQVEDYAMPIPPTTATQQGYYGTEYGTEKVNPEEPMTDKEQALYILSKCRAMIAEFILNN